MKANHDSFSGVQVLCHQAGLTLKRCSSYHWQIRCGVKPVNLYWNESGGLKVHMSGQTRSVYMPIPDAIQLAKAGTAETRPPRAGRGQMRKHRKRMLPKDPHCRWCRRELTEETATVEHIVPRSLGGSNRADNLALACKPCNQTRGGKAVDATPAVALPHLVDSIEEHLL